MATLILSGSTPTSSAGAIKNGGNIADSKYGINVGVDRPVTTEKSSWRAVADASANGLRATISNLGVSGTQTLIDKNIAAAFYNDSVHQRNNSVTYNTLLKSTNDAASFYLINGQVFDGQTSALVSYPTQNSANSKTYTANFGSDTTSTGKGTVSYRVGVNNTNKAL